MPAPTLDPALALADYDLTVKQVDLDDAAATILAVTSYSLEDHVDVRDVAEGNVRRAWAIVASRIRESTIGDAARATTSETDVDFSYNESVEMKAANSISLLSGVPNQLLECGAASWDSFDRKGYKLPPERDNYGVEFPTV